MKTLFLALALIGLPASPSTTKSGIYWTPVPAELSEYAVFPIGQIEIDETGDEIRLEYDLPAELTGPVNRIELSGRRNNKGLTLDGPNARAECPDAGDYSHCRVTYMNLNIDPSVRTELLKSIAKTPNELIKREAVAARFCAAGGGEPCGFLKVLPY